MNTLRLKKVAWLISALMLVSSVVCRTVTGFSDEDGGFPVIREPEAIQIQKQGYIAYVIRNSDSARAVGQKIFLVRHDGSGLVDLGGPFSWNDTPAWSPDGQQLAFWSDSGGNRDIYVLDLKSHKTTRLTDDPAWDIHPCWSPDGSKIAFISGRGGVLDLYVMNSDGSGQEVLFASEFDKSYPVWSPDGKQIAFLEEKGYETLMVIQADGSDARGVAIATGRPAWSPDGQFLAYAGFNEQQSDEWISTNNPEIFVYNFNTETTTRLTDNPGVDTFPAWSPDGKRLIYESDQDDPLFYKRSLYQIEFKGPIENLEKGSVTRLTSGEGMQAAWSPPNLGTIPPPDIIYPAPPPSVSVCPEGCDYASIQPAIDEAKGALIIEVLSGTYREPLIINKSVDIVGRDTGNGQPVLDIPVPDRAIQIQAPRVSLRDFTIVNNAHSGGVASLLYVSSNFNVITGNTFLCPQAKQPQGIRLNQANFNMIRGNDFGDCGDIYLGASSYNQVIGNTVSGRWLRGITVSSNYDKADELAKHLTIARFNLLADNVTNSILIDHLAHENHVVNNRVSPLNEGGAQSAEGRRSETAALTYDGVITLNCGPNLNLVGANQVSNGDGIRLTSTGVFNMILKNQISGGLNGISLERATWELVYGNQVTGVSGYGIFAGAMLELESSAAQNFGAGGGHLIYGNDLMDNDINASDDSDEFAMLANRWDNGAIGNHYSDYDEVSEGCQDSDGNGICDLPHDIPGGSGATDRYPFINLP